MDLIVNIFEESPKIPFPEAEEVSRPTKDVRCITGGLGKQNLDGCG